MSPSAIAPRAPTRLNQRLRSFFRINLRSALLLMAILCGFLAWIARDTHRAYHRSRLYTAVEKIGGTLRGEEMTKPHGLSFANWIGTVWERRLAVPITEVNLGGLKIDDQEMKRIATLIEPLPEVQWLNIGGTSVGDDSIAALAKCRVSVLNLSGTRITDKAATHLSRMETLNSLSLTNTPVGDGTIAALRDLPNLSSLALSGTKVTNAGLDLLANFQALNSVTLNGMQFTDADALRIQRLKRDLHINIDGNLLPSMNELAEAEFVDLVGSDFFSDASLERLDDAPRVERLFLIFPELTAAGLERVKYKHQIRSLNLSWSGVDDEALAALADWHKLEDLHLTETAITDAGLAHLANLPRLKRLWLHKTAITDDGLMKLPPLPELNYLDVSGTSVSDVALQHLRCFPKLQIISAAGSSVTPEGLKRFFDRQEELDAAMTETD